jgi:fatty acid desaturase
MLFRSPWASEISGVMIGTLALTPLSVYRYVHTQHHAYLGGPQDPEFWPYNLPGSPRWKRQLYALLELSAGWVVTPWLYSYRTARAWPKLNPSIRIRLVAEWGWLLLFWISVIWIVGWTNTWVWFVVGHLVPAWLSGSVQTVRKFTEHLGRFGTTIPAMTRTIVYQRPLGQAASKSQLHVEHHGTHHRWPRIPFHHLPLATGVVFQNTEPGLIFSSHWEAICDMLPHLSNPRLGPQWLHHPAQPNRSDFNRESESDPVGTPH